MWKVENNNNNEQKYHLFLRSIKKAIYNSQITECCSGSYKLNFGGTRCSNYHKSGKIYDVCLFGLPISLSIIVSYCTHLVGKNDLFDNILKTVIDIWKCTYLYDTVWWVIVSCISFIMSSQHKYIISAFVCSENLNLNVYYTLIGKS